MKNAILVALATVGIATLASGCRNECEKAAAHVNSCLVDYCEANPEAGDCRRIEQVVEATNYAAASSTFEAPANVRDDENVVLNSSNVVDLSCEDVLVQVGWTTE